MKDDEVPLAFGVPIEVPNGSILSCDENGCPMWLIPDIKNEENDEHV